MYLEVAKHMTTNYAVESSSLHSVTTSVGVEDGGYGVSGSLEIQHTGSMTYEGTVYLPRGAQRRAVTIRPVIDASMNYVCLNWISQHIWHPSGPRRCHISMDASWSGIIHQRSAAYLGCHDGNWDADINNHESSGVVVSAGTTYTAKGGFKTPFASADFATTYGQGTSWSYHFDRTAKRHNFCLSGNGDNLKSSSAVYIENGTRVSTCRGCIPTLKPAGGAVRP